MKILTKWIFDILRKVLFLINMDPMESADNLYRSMVIRASASTYTSESLQGLQMTLNLPNNQTRYIGDQFNKIYPDLIIWRPDYIGATNGQPVLVEAIESIRTYKTSVNKWKTLASLGIRFNLVIPESEKEQIKLIIKEENITTDNLRLQVYRSEGNHFVFTTVKI
ncbi:MAG: hypothetical protein ACOYUB_04625 [Patescibacteria group bacterium]